MTVLAAIPPVVHSIHERGGFLPLGSGTLSGLSRARSPHGSDGDHDAGEHRGETDDADDDAPDAAEDDSGDQTAEHVLKGYLSAYADGGKVTVVYVWDVLDNSGARLHRIQGQETVSGNAADPWAAVPARTMEGIASKTIRQYLDWRGSAPG